MLVEFIIPSGWKRVRHDVHIKEEDLYICLDRIREKLTWHVVPAWSIGEPAQRLDTVIRKI